jgi:hypothetical protein
MIVPDPLAVVCRDLTDLRERVVPGDRQVRVARRVVAHRPGEPPDRLEVVVVPAGQLFDGVGGEELAVGLRGRELPGDVLDPVLVDVQAEP